MDSTSAKDTATVIVTDVLPTIAVEKLVDANGDTLFNPTESIPEPGGTVTYQVTVTNLSPETVTITSVSDSAFGVPPASLAALVGTTLGVGASTTVTYTAPYTEAGTYPNTATVAAQDNEGNPAAASDTATVIVTDVPPTITVDKLVDANGDTLFNPTESIPEPGGTVTYQVTVTNLSPETVTITSVSDSAFGVPPATLAALVGTTLAAGASTTVTYQATYIHAGSYPNTATVSAEDNELNPASAEAHTLRAVYYLVPLGRLPEAEAEMERALALTRDAGSA